MQKVIMFMQMNVISIFMPVIQQILIVKQYYEEILRGILVSLTTQMNI